VYFDFLLALAGTPVRLMDNNGELSGMFKRSHELEDEIRKRLGAIGYGI